MDLTNELKSIRENGDAKEIVNNLYQQQKELEAKLFIVKIIELANVAEKLYQEKEFEKNGIETFVLNWRSNRHDENFFYWNFKDKNDTIIDDNNLGSVAQLIYIVESFGPLTNFNSNFISEKLMKAPPCNLNVSDTIKEDLLNILLSKEFKTALDHSELQLDVKTNEQNESKKKKI